MDRTTATALKAVVLLVVILLAVLAAYALGGLKSSARAGDESVTLTGSAKITVVPDRASVRLGVEVTRPDAKAALDEASRLQERVLAAIQDAGVDEKYIRTGTISVDPEWDYSNDGRRLVGYQARQSVKVTITDLDKAGEVLNAAADEGGNAIRISSFHLYASDKDAAEADARKDAIKDAREKAKQYAEAGDRELGKVLRIEEQVEGDYGSPYEAMDGALLDSAALRLSKAPIEPGEQKVTITVQVVFELD